jgi:hypothetical protein
MACPATMVQIGEELGGFERAGKQALWRRPKAIALPSLNGLRLSNRNARDAPVLLVRGEEQFGIHIGPSFSFQPPLPASVGASYND